MASLRDAVKDNAAELREGIPWVVFWREGRSWNSEAVFFSYEYAADTIDPDDMPRLEQISRTDPRAVALNGYYCGRLGEDMTIDELTRGVRWHYENNYNTLADFIEAHTPFLPPEQVEEAREAAHAAGLPFSERPYDGREPDPYVYDGSMTPEDYELWQQNIEQERSAEMEHPLYIQLHNRERYAQGELSGEWLKLPATAEQLHAAMERVGITADNRQDLFINGLNTNFEALTRLSFDKLDAAGIDELNYLAAALQSRDDRQIDKLNAAAEITTDMDSVHRLIELTQNTGVYDFHPDIANLVQLGEHTLEHSGMIQIPDEWAAAIDIEMLGQLAAASEKGMFTEYGYIVPNGDEWQPVNEVPEQYRIVSFPQPELTAEEAAALAGERDRALRDIGEDDLEPPNPYDIDPPIDYEAAPAVATMPPPEVAQQPELAAAPLPVKVISLESEKPAEKLKEITDKLEQGITDIFASENYQNYLNTMSKFHNYSLNNTILIAMQKPDATHVAGFNTWKNDFERNVMKGQKGIKIIAPSPYKVKVQQEVKDPATGRPVIGADGKPVTEETERKIPAYKVVSVFDVSQTEGKELPTIGADMLTGDVERYGDFFAALEQASPTPIGFEEIHSGAKGYYSHEDKRIAIQEGMSELQTLKTAIHEIAHARLHDIDLTAEQEQARPDRRTREVEAESVAYTVCQHYGLDTSEYSFGYVAGWSSDKELTELKASLETIRKTAAEIINEVDGHFAALEQGREQTADRQAAPIQQQEQDTPQQTPAVELPEQTAAQERYTVRTEDSGIYIFDTVGNHYHGENGLVVRYTEEAAAREAAQELNNQQAAEQRPPEYEPQPGFEEWSEPATPDNGPDIPGVPSDDIDAYLPPQGEQPAQDEQGDDVNPTRTEPTPTTTTYYSISEDAARRAKHAISFFDYKPGSATAEYRQSVDEAVQIAERQKARVDPMYHDKIDRLLDTYARKLAENLNHGYAITARVPSVMIAGPANFPVRAKEQQNAASHSNMEEWRHIQGLLDKISSTGMGGISADDPNAVKKLQDKLSGLQEAQETMKAANAFYRKHKTLDGCPVLSAEQIGRLTADMKTRWYGREARQPFEAYALQNNNAEINRLKKRIEELQHREEAVFSGWQFDGGKVEVNKQDNRLQVFFDGKPDEATRTELKRGGFKWAPSVGAWQRQITANAFYAANDIKAIQPLTGEKPTDLQRRARREADAARQQPEQPQDNPAIEQERTPGPGDTYSIYQLKDDDSTRDFRFEPYERLQAAGLAVDPANYVLVYSGQLGAADTLETIFEKFNIDRPADFTGHSLSVSDVVTLNRDGRETAHYVDSFGYKEVPEFLQPPAPALDMQQAAAEPNPPDDYLTGEKIETPRGRFSLADMTVEQMNAAGYGYHHSSDDGKYHIMANGMRAFAIVNPLRTAEMSTEQNYNMIDGIPNNTPSVSELEAKAKAGEQISLTDLAAAIKAERGATSRDEDKKPSIREQLRAAREQQHERPAPDKTRDKSPGLEV